jgi:hypothetical protein
MPGFLLHLGATVMCLHGGQAQPAAATPRVRLSGQPVVVQPTPYAVAGCPFMAGPSPSPCLTCQWITAAVRVRAGGVPVLLQDSQAVCVPNGTGLLILVTQVRVRGM